MIRVRDMIRVRVRVRDMIRVTVTVTVTHTVRGMGRVRSVTDGASLAGES